jgi:preprotein translocase subunit YajC
MRFFFQIHQHAMPKMPLSSVQLLLAQAQTAAPVPGGVVGQPPPNPLLQFMPLVLMAAAFYFLLIAPQRKKQKEHEKLLAALEPGDEIITTGGIYGVVTSVKEDRLVVRIAENAKIELGRAFVQAVVRKAGADK